MHSIDELKKFTHKRNESEIFVNDLVSISDTHFSASFRYPKDHPHYDDFYHTHTDINSMFLLECARQIETYISHIKLAIPLENKFILKNWKLISKPTFFILSSTEQLLADIFIDWSSAKKIMATYLPLYSGMKMH